MKKISGPFLFILRIRLFAFGYLGYKVIFSITIIIIKLTLAQSIVCIEEENNFGFDIWVIGLLQTSALPNNSRALMEKITHLTLT